MSARDSQATEPVRTEPGGQHRRIRKKEIYPEPGNTTECNFQAARPIDSDRIGILGVPMMPLPEQLFCIFGIARQAECLGKRHQMLVAVQFPSHFAVAYF